MNACEEPEGYVDNDLDCDDTDADANPEGDEESWNGVDEDCDGYDFTGEECVDEALELTMDWMDAWTWGLATSSGSALFHTFTFSDKTLDVNPNSTTAEAGPDGLTVDVSIETNMTIESYLNITGPVLTEACDVTIGPVPVVYTGTVELNVDGETVGGEVELSHVVAGAVPSSFGSGCSVGILDTVASIYGYDLLGFVDADVDDVAQELADAIENDLVEYDIPLACDAEEPEPEPEPEDEDCEDGRVEDCAGDCYPESWIGDGYCEDGTTSWGGDFDCAEFDWDGGDCE
jgi:hypothetical protein